MGVSMRHAGLAQEEHRVNSHPVNADLWRRVYTRVLKYWKALALAMLFLIGVAASQPLLAILMKPLLDGGFNGQNPDYVWMIPLAIIGIFLVRGVMNFLSDYLMAWSANHVLADLRIDMFDRLLRLPDAYFKRMGSSLLLNRFVSDAASVMQLATEVITVLVRETLIVVSLVCVLLYLSWQLTLIALIAFPLSTFIMRAIARRIRGINRETIVMNAELTRVVSEAIDGQRVIKLFSGYEHEEKRFFHISGRLRRFAMRNTVAGAASAPITQAISAVALAVVVATALGQSGANQITVGGFAAFVTAMIQMLDPLKRLANIASPMQRMLVAAESVFALMDELPESDTGTRTLPQPVRGHIEFEHVSHRFPEAGRDTLADISLEVAPGQTVAFIGRSGSGKTTLVSMLPRFTLPSAGTIRVDGVPVDELTLTSLRDSISLVSQDVVLFDDTIAANVGYGANSEPSEQAIRQALADANLLEFVDSLPQGIHSQVGENAARLSGGQRQRLAIARALIKDAPILILDEATSALDNESERQVQASLERLMAGRTTLVIAHRLSTVQNADRIVVLDQGHIVEQGHHADLLAADGLYAALYKMQFNEGAAAQGGE
ncbi:Lipid A export ATP-binding/permease protein MsbA [Pigmentiphaga humi]|uniref:Lipid A export ATP-binding/permease protein MsbA n=1 Tax=Pigmentiphaga humi TaxID=2478468 RepID=A0A3P4B7N8_9BURK|nr:lipid A export permease/ATP-binding protein MsbA [Pigmentiphaga humi]VCU71165.1 Lipid A export ATP-binding/permease protein MsbA [Pigmentiphaga humi]